MTLTLWEHLYAVVVGLLFPIAGALQHGGAGETEKPTTREKLFLYYANAVLWAALAGLALLVWSLGDKSLADLGLTVPPSSPGTGLGLAALFLLLYGADTWWQIATPQRLAATRKRWREQTPFMPANRREILHSLVMVAAAAVFEEIVYRGFLIGYLMLLLDGTTGAVALAVGLPALVFAVCHLYQNVASVVKIAVLSCLFGAIFVVTGSLWIPIALHFAVDLLGSLMGPWLLGEDRSQ